MAGACTNEFDTGFVALGYAKVAVLGVVQGITELLPISSTAHIRVLPALLGWQDPGSAFSAAMQLAALPEASKSGAVARMGISDVPSIAALITGLLGAKIMSTLDRTSSFTSSGRRAGWE